MCIRDRFRSVLYGNLVLPYTDWVHAWIKRNILGLDVSEAPKGVFFTADGHPCLFIMSSRDFSCFASVSVQPAPAETSSTEQSTHEAPEIEIGIICASLKFHPVILI